MKLKATMNALHWRREFISDKIKYHKHHGEPEGGKRKTGLDIYLQAIFQL